MTTTTTIMTTTESESEMVCFMEPMQDYWCGDDVVVTPTNGTSMASMEGVSNSECLSECGNNSECVAFEFKEQQLISESECRLCTDRASVFKRLNGESNDEEEEEQQDSVRSVRVKSETRSAKDCNVSSDEKSDIELQWSDIEFVYFIPHCN